MTNLPQKGFTLIELVLAMGLFITILVVATSGFVAINRTFSRGLIRKQLSEASQVLNDDVTQLLRASATTAPATRLTTDATPLSELCFPANRYVWNPKQGGLYKIDGACAAAAGPEGANIAASKVLVSTKFEVLQLTVTPAQNTNGHFYQISGVLRTLDDAAFNFPTDPVKIACKGSAQSTAVRGCAVERFNFTTNVRGLGVAS